MDFANKSRYDKIFQQVTHKGGDSVMNYIKRFQHEQNLSFSLGNIYSEDKLIHIFMDDFFQGGKYSAQIASYQAELSREVKSTDKNLYLFHPYILVILILTADQVVVEIVREKILSIQSALFCGGANYSAES